MQNPDQDNLNSQVSASSDTQLNALNADPTFVEPPTNDAIRQPSQVYIPAASEVGVKNFIVNTGESHKLRNALIGFAVAIFSVLIAVSIYYFLIRIPDAEYQRASSITDAMTSGAKKMAEIGKRFQGLDDIGDRTIEELSAELKQYKANLAQLQGSAVMKGDGSVKAAYDVNKQRIEDYATSTANFIDTVDVYLEVKQKCNSPFDKVNNGTTLAEYDALLKDCKDYLGTHSTVSDKNFNDNYYEPWRDGLLDYIAAVRVLLKAYASNDQAGYVSAVKSVQVAQGEIVNAGSGKDVDLTNTLNPSEQLSNLRAVINKRESQLLR